MSHVPETHEPKSYRIPTPDGKSAKIQRTFTNAQIVNILRDALDILEELDPPEDMRAATFQSALNMTGQMTHIQSALTIAPPIQNGRA